MIQNKKKALIAMSGGVDSSVAALLMQQQGYDCLGITMKLYHNEDIGISREHTCCSLDDIEDARGVAARLNMPYYVCNFTSDFKCKVIEKFVATYLKGFTPNPCIDCNRYMKFEDLWQRARELECDCIVTGHYVRKEYDASTGKYYLKKALDLSKDQSYVLYFMSQEQLSHTEFPMGDQIKESARNLAEAHGLLNARKHDSQDICFVPDGNYKKVIEQYACEACKDGKEQKYQLPGEGDFVDRNGKVLGRHKGIYSYTIGQRKGLGIAAAAPLYVVDIDVEHNRVVLGANEDLFSRHVHAEDVSFVNPPEQEIRKMRVSAKIRYRHKEQPGTLTINEDGSVDMLFDEPQRAVTKGQALVLYDGDYVLGGGIIC
jgi:tRNA-specific 2-thiouridylase